MGKNRKAELLSYNIRFSSNNNNEREEIGLRAKTLNEWNAGRSTTTENIDLESGWQVSLFSRGNILRSILNLFVVV